MFKSKKWIIFVVFIIAAESFGWMRTIFASITLVVALESGFRIFNDMSILKPEKDYPKIKWQRSTKIIVFVIIVSVTAIVTGVLLHWIHPDMTKYNTILEAVPI